MPLVRMLTTSATPERILLAGKVYNLPKALAEELVNSSHQQNGAIKHAEYATDAKKVERIPAQPDPQDVPEPDLDEDDDEGDE